MSKRQSYTYHLKATGSACYDETGITFPQEIKIDLARLVKDALRKAGANITYSLTWARPEANQPHVLIVRMYTTAETNYPDIDAVCNRVAADLANSPAGPYLIFRPIEW